MRKNKNKKSNLSKSQRARARVRPRANASGGKAGKTATKSMGKKGADTAARAGVSAIRRKAESLEASYRTRIRVVGIGGGAGNIVSEISERVPRIDFVAANTDSQALGALTRKVKKFSFGQEFTRGLGCGMDAELGEQAAQAEKERIKKMFDGQDVSILVACLGGGTGSGAAPVFAEAAKEFKNLTLGIFTMPFPFEGEKRKQLAQEALEKLKGSLNAYVIIPNERIFRVITDDTPLKESFSEINKRLTDTIEGLIDTISVAGLINIDFADVKSTLEGRGKLAYINSATAQGPGKVQQALQEVLMSPISDYGAEGVERMLFNITGEKDLKMHEVAQVSKAISDYNPRARIVMGISCTSKFKDKIRITLFAVGCRDGNVSVSAKKANGKAKKLQNGSTGEVSAGKLRKKPPAKQKKEKELPVSELKEKPAEEPLPAVPAEPERVRRSAVEVKRAVDQEMEELQEKEKKWDVPAFLRNSL